MKSTSKLLLIVLIVTHSCNKPMMTDNNSADKLYDFQEYNRFILAKGGTSFAPGAKISEFGQLPEKGDVYDHVFYFGEISGWDLIKVTEELDNVYFNNIAYWLLGFSDDPGSASQSVIVLTDKETHKIKYLGIIDSAITKIEDSMLLLSDTDKQYIIEIPFHTFSTVNDRFDYNIQTFLKDNSITAEDFKDPVLETVTIRFNERTGR